MTALPSNIVAYQPLATTLGPLLPQTITEAMQLARVMSEARMVPEHLRGSPADCFLIVNQARLWRMDPFAVAQGTSFIHGKIMYEGKLTAAVVHSLGNLKGRLSYNYSGEGENRTVTVSGTLTGETEPRTVSVRLKDAKTNNKVWQTQPDQQLSYHGARVWARRHVPEVMLGIYAAEEFDAPPPMRDITPEPIEQFRPPKSAQPPTASPKPPLEVVIGDGWDPAKFPRTGKGLKEALAFITGAVLDGKPGVVALNNGLLDTIAERMPELAEEIAELRASAAEAMIPPDDEPEPEEDEDDFPAQP